MLEVIRDNEGRITACCEWLLFNDKGLLDEKGETIFVGELEINPEHRGNGVIRKLIRRGIERSPHAKRIFWFREYKYPGRGHRMYSTETLKRRS
jgi:GNAT superfamily N-acetyltransferase